MKTAICYSGEASRINLEFIKTELSQLICDEIHVFCSFWDNGVSQNNLFDEFQSVVNDSKNKLIKLEVRPQLSPQLRYDHSHLWSKANSVPNTYSMFASIKFADILRQQYEIENNFQYDLVIRARPDTVLSKNIDLIEIKNILDNEAMVVFSRSNNSFWIWHNKIGMLADTFWIANSNIMTQITNLDFEQCCDEGCRCHPESVLWWRIVKQLEIPLHLQIKEIPWYRFLDFKANVRNISDPDCEAGYIIRRMEEWASSDDVKELKLVEILKTLGIDISQLF